MHCSSVPKTVHYQYFMSYNHSKKLLKGKSIVKIATKSVSCVSKRLPNPWQEVVLVRNGVVMIKFNSNLVNFFDIFGISISGINRNANTLIRYFKKYLDTIMP